MKIWISMVIAVFLINNVSTVWGQSKMEEYDLKGPVKIVEITEEILGNSGLWRSSKNYFTITGKIEKSESQREYNFENHRKTIYTTYDNKERITKIVRDTNETIFDYQEDHYIFYKIENGKQVSRGTLDQEGRILSSETENDGSRKLSLIYGYDSQGNRIFSEMIQNDESISKIQIKYNSQNRVIKKVTDTSQMSITGTYKYNKEGNLTQKTEYSVGKGVKNNRIVNYSYEMIDHQGNWLKRVAKNTQGVKLEINERIIYYY